MLVKFLGAKSRPDLERL
uniref:Uncharacterized protein n=1 Tax=Tetraselmis sp. GSL018 TaxID=582737 RepID=A0A061S7J7_9CHLO